MIGEILEKAAAGEVISAKEGETLFQIKDALPLGQAAAAVTERKHPDQVVTYIIDRNINYTNVCVVLCDFCAFYRRKNAPDAYVLTHEQIAEKIRETIALGGRQVLMQGGHHPEFRIDFYENMFRRIKEEFDIHIHALSPPEIVHISNVSRLSVQEVISRLREAGLDSIPGGGAEILVDRVRKEISPLKCTTDQWLDVMRTAHRLGMRTTATMMFGHVETLAERVEHLIRLRELQEETGGFTAFIPWTYQPGNTNITEEHASAVDYLKTLAVSRILLHNFDNVQASWVTQGSKIGQVSLFFGANDMGSIMIEENVVRAAGVNFRMTEHEIRRLIEDAGYTPKRRNMTYQYLS